MTMMNEILETAQNLAAQWQRTDPMRSREEVHFAVLAVESELTYTPRDEDREYLDPEAVTDALLPLLRRNGTLID